MACSRENFTLHLYLTSRSTCAVPKMAVLCSSVISCFPGMLLRYFLNDFEMVPVAPIIVGITFVFTVHMRCISVVRSSHFTITILYYLLLLLLLRSRHIHKHECNVNWIEWDDWVNTSSISFCCTDEFLFWCPVRSFFKYYCSTCTSAGFTIGLCAVKLPSTYTDRNAVAASMLNWDHVTKA